MFRLFLFLFLTLSSSGLFAQAPQLGTTIEKEFEATAVPDKWKNESAVIIGQKTEYLFSRIMQGKNPYVVRTQEYIHKRIKLQDKNALEKYSTFYYATMGKDGNAQYNIIKPNGKEKNVNMSTAIEEEQDVPAIYRSILLKANFKKMKIAIPDLEVGDIIDFTIKSTYDWDMKLEGIQFTPFIFSLANTYPTMFQQYRFTMADGMKVKYRAYNGAPNIKYDPKASVFGDRNSYLSYYFLDKDREKMNEERWSLEYRNTPTVKFRVVLLADNDEESKGLGQATIDRSGLLIEDVYKRYAPVAGQLTPTVSSLVGYTTEYMVKKKTDGSLKTDDDIIRETYYCLRKVFLEMYYKGPVHSDLEKVITGKKLYKKIMAAEKKDVTSQKEEKEDEIRINGVTFATALRVALAAMGIQSELFVYEPRSLGGWRDAIFMEELDYVLRVKGKKKFYYLEAFNNFDAFATPFSYLEGAEGYAIGYQEKDQYARATVPPSTMNDNIEREEYILNFANAMDMISVERTSSYLGATKSGKIEQANLDRSYLNFDFEKYYNEPKKNKKSDNVAMEISNKYDDPEKDERIKDRKELFEKDLKGEFDIDKYEDFELIKDGRFGDTAWLKYSEKFTLKKLISKAGKNYIVEIGKMIGDQIKLDSNEIKNRQTDIWIPFARTIENTITVNIPAGYTVDGLQDLDTNVTNESGGFASTAKVDGDKLIITTRKLYKKSFDKKELWPNYIAFLEPADKFSQAKIVLKKK
ncbi:MAG TPA: DUF3857 domain-containing protein [Flavisolibacter sp.]|jgi:hypothetical protein|nr:DUF3857 domain-containing protein [Flavisolibacter sp.]